MGALHSRDAETDSYVRFHLQGAQGGAKRPNPEIRLVKRDFRDPAFVLSLELSLNGALLTVEFEHTSGLHGEEVEVAPDDRRDFYAGQDIHALAEAESGG